MGATLVEDNVHYVWLGKLPEGKDSMFGVLKSIVRMNQSTKDINESGYGFKKFYIHTDNPDNIKNAINRHKEFFAEIKKLEKELNKEMKDIKNNLDTIAALVVPRLRDSNYWLHKGLLDQYNKITKTLELKFNKIKKEYSITDNDISFDNIWEIDTLLTCLNDATKKIIINDINEDEKIKAKFAEYQFISGIYGRYQMEKGPQFAGMADCLRVVALNVYGGIYFDFDIGVPVIPSQERPDFMNRLIYDEKPSIMNYHDGSINNSIIMLNKGNDFLLKGIEETIKKDLIENRRNKNPTSRPNQNERFYRDMSGKKIPQNESCTPRSEFWFVCKILDQL